MLIGLKVSRARERTTSLVSEGDAEQVISPPGNAVVRLPKREEPLPAHLIQRNEAVRYIQQNGLPKWKEVQGCHQRNLNETVMFRYKTIFGGEMKARTAANQTAEVKLKCFLLNTFRETGMPDSYKSNLNKQVTMIRICCIHRTVATTPLPRQHHLTAAILPPVWFYAVSGK
jgi:hypothetical protein